MITPDGPTVRLKVQLVLSNDATIAKAALSSTVSSQIADPVLACGCRVSMAVIVVAVSVPSFTNKLNRTALSNTMPNTTKPSPWFCCRESTINRLWRSMGGAAARGGGCAATMPCAHLVEVPKHYLELLDLSAHVMTIMHS